MQSYKRKITYFYQYHNGNVGSTAGFLKLEIRGDKVKIMINIQETPGLPYHGASLYFYHEAGDHLAALKVDTVESVNGILAYQNRTEWQQLFDTGRDLYTFDGVAVVYNDSHYYIGDFQDRNRKDYTLVLKEKKTEPARTQGAQGTVDKEMEDAKEDSQKEMQAEETIRAEEAVNSIEFAKEEELELPKGEREKTAATGETENIKKMVENLFKKEEPVKEEKTVCAKTGKDVYEKCENCPYYKRRVEQQEQEDAFEKMLEEYPKLPMYGATELFSCVRIHPKDIGKLDMRNWKLGVNSFLTHGFYTYQYLLLGKMRFDDGSEHPIIGVPGVFSNREKYLANMFGFEQFIPVKKTGVKTGEFGYWIVEISPYL